MWLVVFQTVYFLLPAYFANMCPVFAAKLRLPFGSAINSNAFGAHKTYRGIIAGVLGALLVTALQAALFRVPILYAISLVDYSQWWILLGFLLGFGALFGDLVKSYFKRRMGIIPGGVWFPFDQLDFVVGALLFGSILFIPPVSIIIIALVLTPLLHFLTNILGYWLGLKDVWW